MALVWGDRVLETSTTIGTGALTLAAAITGYQRFSAVCSTSDTVYYSIFAVDASGNPSGDWETGLGTYSSANTLTRTTVSKSSNANAAVNFAAGTKWVMATPIGALVALLGRTDLANTWTLAQTMSALLTLSAGANLTLAATPATNAVGYLGAPQNIVSGTYTTVMADAGKHFYHTSGSAHTITIDSNANVAYPIGTILTFINENAGGVVTIAITSDTLRWGSSTGSRSLAANGTATAIKVTSTVWRLTGDGIT